MKTANGCGMRLKNAKGQSIVEISLITPLLLIALYIPADFGISLFMAHLTQNAAREGARIGSGLASPFGNAEATTVKSEVFSRMPNNTYVTNRSVSVKYYHGIAGTPCMQFVEVSATIDYNFFLYQILRLFGATVPNFITITRTTDMRYNYQPYGNTIACPAFDSYGPYSS